MGRKTRKRRPRRRTRRVSPLPDSYMRFERILKEKRLRPEPHTIMGCRPL